MTPPLMADPIGTAFTQTPTAPSVGSHPMSTGTSTATSGRVAAQRARFLDDAVATASPARLVTMLYDRLLLDLTRGADAQYVGDRHTANTHLLHAQEIVLELAGSLRQDVWSGSEALASLYGFMHAELVRANIACDPDRTRAVRVLVEPLAEAWRAAAVEVSVAAAPVDRAG
jgi:flagellar protein FliS